MDIHITNTNNRHAHGQQCTVHTFVNYRLNVHTSSRVLSILGLNVEKDIGKEALETGSFPVSSQGVSLPKEGQKVEPFGNQS